MPFRPFAHLARVSLAKGIVHTYAPSAVAAGQSLGEHVHTYPLGKLSKTSHLQNAFSGPSSSGTGAGAGPGAGPGAKAGHTTQSSGGDGGLGQYYAAWHHAQQTGDDADWKQHQSNRKIGLKEPEKEKSNGAHRQVKRLDSIRAADILRPSVIKRGRAHSETVVQELREAEDATAEAIALAKIDEAIAQEVKDVQASRSEQPLDVSASEQEPARHLSSPVTNDEGRWSDEVNSASPPSTTLSSPGDEAWILSNKIVQLGRQNRFSEIPQQFQSMVKDGLVPTADAYNQIIVSAIKLSNGYQPYPRALEIYSDMTARAVTANQETYAILISYLTKQGLDVITIQAELARQQLRYSHIIPSVQHQRELYAGDVSIQFAAKFYNIAVASVKDFQLSTVDYNNLLQAHARSGSAQDLRHVLGDMQKAGVPVAIELYTTIIDACASVKDIELATECYRDYRDRAIGRILEPLDVKVYVSLIRAYYAAGADEEGIKFYEKVIQSFQYSAEKEVLCAQVTDSFVVDGLVQHHVEAGKYEQALQSMDSYPLTDKARVQAYNKIATGAADNGQIAVAVRTYSHLKSDDIDAGTAMAIVAMYFRAGHVVEGKSFWAKTQKNSHALIPDVPFTTTYTLELINAGMVEEGLSHAQAMFRQIRSGRLVQSKSPYAINREVDEVVALIAKNLFEGHQVISSNASVLLFRIMIENGGLIPAITRDAIARLGPECVHQLGPQDIALALHVQAIMLKAHPSLAFDTAQPARFSHLLETVTERSILMDPSTIAAVNDALPRLGGGRPDLEQRWQVYLRPTARENTASHLQSPVIPQTPVIDHSHIANAYDPYSNTVDVRASRIISDTLESTTGRIENHLADSMSRLRNVRRIGRRLQYGAYAKLITTAGKAKQANLMREILGMAQTDVPFNAQIPSVKSGWSQIYDAMVAACLTVGDRQMAAKFHQDLLNMGAAPSANTFGIYITTLEGTFDEATEAVKIFQQAIAEGVTPSVFLFNAVIGKLGKARRIDDCLQYFGQMQNMGIRPSSVTYGTLVNALCRTSEETFAVDMFEEMESAPNYRARPAPYNSIIQYFLNTKRDRSKVLQYYGRMQSRNIKPTSHTYKLLLEAYATLEPVNLTAAEAVLADMRANGVQPEAVHYGSLIHARGCVMGDMAGARKIFDSVLADPSIKPTDNLYQNLLEAMVANHEVAQTDEILASMKSRGIAMTPYIANTLIHGWAGKGDTEKARSIYDSLGIKNREPSTYEAMTRAFLSVEDRVGAQTVVTEMLQKGYPSAVAEKILALVGGTV